MRKIFTDFPICGTFELSADDAHHVVVVLRHTVGDTLNVTDCTGATYECFITRMEGHSAYLTPARKLSDGPSANGKVILQRAFSKVTSSTGSSRRRRNSVPGGLFLYKWNIV